MAGVKIVDGWILEYICHRAWKEFTDTSSLSAKTIDFIQGVLPAGVHQTESEVERSRIYFLIVLCRLLDGDKVEVDYKEDQDATVLEDMLTFFDLLIKSQSGELQEKGYGMIDNIKLEAVLVCCRESKLATAKEVFKRLWGNVSNKDMNKILLKDLISSKKDITEWLPAYTYDNFKQRLTDYLALIYTTFSDPPLLVKAANSLKSISDDLERSTRSPNGKRKFNRDEVLAAMFPEDENNNADTRAASCKQKLRKLWNCQMREKFGSPSPKKQGEAQESSNTDISMHTPETSQEEEPPEPTGKSSRFSERLKLLDSDSDQETQNPDKSAPHKSSPQKSVPRKPSPQKSLPQKRQPSQTSKVIEVPAKKQTQSRQSSRQKTVPTNGSPQKSTVREPSPEIFIASELPPQKSTPSEQSPQKSTDKQKTPQKSTDREKTHQKSTVRDKSPPRITSSETCPPESTQPGGSRRKAQPGSEDSPEKQTDSTFRSPPPASLSSKLAYRKNQGRENRHEPSNQTRQDDDTASNSSFGMQSFVSVSSARRKWTEEEMVEFYTAVKVEGVGNWAKIRDLMGTTRTSVMLKDKWRNMVKSGDVDQLTEIDKERIKAKRK